MKTKSFLRREEYRMLAQLTLSGKVLDVGGSKKSGYHKLIQGEHEIVTANIDEAYGTDLVFDAEKPWPVETASFDAVLFINVLEHVYAYNDVLAEAVRVLKSEGRIAGVVPFMLNVHGTPNDYFRYTRATLERTLSEHRFTNIRVKELGTGVFSVVYQTLIGFVFWYWLARPLMMLSAMLDRLVSILRPNNKLGPAYMPLGYYFEATKGI